MIHFQQLPQFHAVVDTVVNCKTYPLKKKKNPLGRVYPDALCLKPGLVDALGGADQQSVQRRRGPRSSGPSRRHLPGQQRQQHQQPLHGRLRPTAVAGRDVSKKLPERPLRLNLNTEGSKKTNARNVAVQRHIWTPLTRWGLFNIPKVYETETSVSLN